MINAICMLQKDPVQLPQCHTHFSNKNHTCCQTLSCGPLLVFSSGKIPLNASGDFSWLSTSFSDPLILYLRSMWVMQLAIGTFQHTIPRKVLLHILVWIQQQAE